MPQAAVPERALMSWRVLTGALVTWVGLGPSPVSAQRAWGLPTGDVLILVVADAEEPEATGPRRMASPLDQVVSPITGFPMTPSPSSSVDSVALEPGCATPPGRHASCPLTWWDRWQAHFDDDVQAVCLDFQHMYTGKNLCCLAAVVAVAAPLANTHADQGIRDWYQREVVDNRPYWHRKSGVNDFFDTAGEWQVMVPIYLGSWALGSLFDERPAARVAGQWGERTLRAMLVGSVASGSLQFGLGGGRPGEGSHWRPFQDSNTVAGHGFVGAVPFLTAASMTRCKPLRWTLFAASFGTTWTRLDRDAHYFSQCLLGWSIAYLATQSVSMTELEMRRMQLAPIELPQGGAGVGLMVRY